MVLASEGSEELSKHPYGGLLASIVCLAANLSFDESTAVENFWISELGWRFLGLALAHTKLDAGNPALREWSLMVVRNLTKWSDQIRLKLKDLTLIDKS